MLKMLLVNKLPNHQQKTKETKNSTRNQLKCEYRLKKDNSLI